MRTLIGTTFEVQMGHMLSHHEGACRNAHGHTYKIEIEADGEVDPKSGMVVDFSTFRSKLFGVVMQYDHAFLVNEDAAPDHDSWALLRQLLGHNVTRIHGEPTAEVIAHRLAKRCYEICKGMGVSLRRVRVWETSDSYACVEM